MHQGCCCRAGTQQQRARLQSGRHAKHILLATCSCKCWSLWRCWPCRNYRLASQACALQGWWLWLLEFERFSFSLQLTSLLIDALARPTQAIKVSGCIVSCKQYMPVTVHHDVHCTGAECHDIVLVNQSLITISCTHLYGAQLRQQSMLAGKGSSKRFRQWNTVLLLPEYVLPSGESLHLRGGCRESESLRSVMCSLEPHSLSASKLLKFATTVHLASVALNSDRISDWSSHSAKRGCSLQIWAVVHC